MLHHNDDHIAQQVQAIDHCQHFQGHVTHVVNLQTQNAQGQKVAQQSYPDNGHENSFTCQVYYGVAPIGIFRRRQGVRSRVIRFRAVEITSLTVIHHWWIVQVCWLVVIIVMNPPDGIFR